MTDLFPLEQITDQADNDSWTPLRLADAPDTPPIQPVLGGTGLLYPGKRHVFSGPPESAKTLAAYTMLILIARAGGTGILIDFEMGVHDAKTRLRELGARQDELERLLYVGPTEPATPARIATLIARNPQLVVVDAAVGAYQVEGLDDNKRGDVEKISRLYVTAFWQQGIATLLIDHVVKNAEARGRFVIGSERKLGSSDVHLGFDTLQPISRGTNGLYKITTHKDRGGALKRGHLADFHVESDPDTHQISWTYTTAQTDTAPGGYFRPTHLMEKVSQYLELQPEPVNRNTIYDALRGKKNFVLKAIDALVIEGFAVEQTDSTTRSKPVKSVRPYRQNDPESNPETDPMVPDGSRETGNHSILCSSRTVPHNHAVVPDGSHMVPDQTPEVVPGGLREYYVLPTGEPSNPTTETVSWLDNNGTLDEGDYDRYLASIEPDPEELN